MLPVSQMDELEGLLQDWIRWFRVRRAFSWTFRAAVIGLALALVMSLLTILLPQLPWELLKGEFLGMVVALVLIFVGAAFIASYLWPFPLSRAARYFDRTFELSERVSTALELAEQGSEALPASEILSLQRQDALEMARQVQPRDRLPLKLARQDIIAGTIIAAGLVFVWFFGQPYFDTALQQRAVQAAISTEIERIESARETIQSETDLEPERRAELDEPLQQALEGLGSSENMEQAVSVLTGTQERLESLSDWDALQAGEQLKRIGSDLARQQGSPLGSFGGSLADGETNRAAGELLSIDPASLDAEGRQALSDQLGETAAALEESVPELAAQMREAAEALSQEDLQSARQALEQAAQTLVETGQQILQSELAQQTADELAEGGQRVIQAGRDAAGSQGEQASGSEADGAGQGTGEGLASGEGNGAGDSSGAGQGTGSGSPADSGSPPDSGSPSEDGPIAQDNPPGDGDSRPYEQIFAPQRLGEGQGGDLVTLPRSGQTGSQVTGQGNVAPGEPGEIRVPYEQALPLYDQKYREAMDSPQLPIYLRPIVRDYFSFISP